MRFQLSENSKAEFIELIAKDSITCWFEGDEFVMPSGQGKTAKGIVLGKLLVWQYRQTEVDEAMAKAQMCRDEKTHAINRWSAVCKERDELQRRNQMLIETQAEKLIDLRDEKAELQKRVDAAFRVLSRLNALDDEAHKRWKREACMFSQGESNAYEHAVRLLEQALEGGSND